MKINFWLERRTIVAVAVSILTLAEIVDLTIVSVALPDIMGALQANINEISLTMTSYIVASAVFIPLTGYVSNRFGYKSIILGSAVIFGVSSIMCGLATTLSEMVIFRLIQGVGGAFLPSMAQAYIVRNFTQEEQPKIMVLYSLCVVLGPVLGPIFGGYLVENMSWQWIFYVNVPICLLGFLLVYFLMEDTPKENISADYLSFFFMMVGIGCLEYVLDEGNQFNWFESQHIIIIFACGILALIFFIWRGLLGKSIVNFALFKNMNFNLSCFTVFMFMVMAIISMAYFPTLLQQGYGYPVDTAGYIVAPRGITAFIAAPVFMLLAKKYDGRILMFCGMVIYAISCYVLTLYGTNQNPNFIVFSVALQGIGLTGTFVILMQIAFIGLKKLSNDASGVFNFFRNIGNSVGTSIAATVITRQQQASWNSMAVHVSPTKIGYILYSSQAQHMPLALKVKLLGLFIAKQGFLIGNLDIFYISFIGMLCILWIPFVLKRPEFTSDGMGAGLH